MRNDVGTAQAIWQMPFLQRGKGAGRSEFTTVVSVLLLGPEWVGRPAGIYCRIGVDVTCGEMSRADFPEVLTLRDSKDARVAERRAPGFVGFGGARRLAAATRGRKSRAMAGIIQRRVSRGHARAICIKSRVSRVACPKSTYFSSRHQPQFYSIGENTTAQVDQRAGD